jgi:fimbrial chaperone protein
MITRRRVLATAGGLVLLAAAPRAARAAQLEFVPITIHTMLGSAATTLQVINHGGGSSVMQVRAFAWQQTPDGDDSLVHSDAIVVSPPMFTVAEGDNQIVRVVLHTAPGPTELAFRILLDEIPPPNATGVQMALRVSLPVFATPSTGTPELHWRVARAGSGLQVTVRNSGALHAQIAKLALALPGRAAVDGKLQQRLPYVLPGAERRWTVALPAPPGAEVRLTADIDAKAVALSLPIEA